MPRTAKTIPLLIALLAASQPHAAPQALQLTDVIRTPGNKLFIARRDPGATQPKLYLRLGPGHEKLLVDPDTALAPDAPPQTLSGFAPSPDGLLLAYGLSPRGASPTTTVLHVMDVRTNEEIGTPIEGVAADTARWTPDGLGLAYATGDASHRQTLLLQIGDPKATPRPIFDSATGGTPSVTFTSDGRWAIGTVERGPARGLEISVAAQAGALAGHPVWQPLAQTADNIGDNITDDSYALDTLYVVSHDAAGRSQLVAIDLADPAPAAAPGSHRHTVIVPASDERVIVHVAAAADALYVEERSGGMQHLARRAYAHPGDAAPAADIVALPADGGFTLERGGPGAVGAVHPRLPGALILLLQAATARAFAIGPDGRVIDIGLVPAPEAAAPDGER